MAGPGSEPRRPEAEVSALRRDAPVPHGGCEAKPQGHARAVAEKTVFLLASCLCLFGPLSQKYHAPGGRNNGHSFLKVLGAGSLRSRCRQAGCGVGALALVGGQPISSCVLTWCRGRGGSPGSLIRVPVPFARAAPSQLVTSQRPRLPTLGLRLQCDEGGGPHAFVSKTRPLPAGRSAPARRPFARRLGSAEAQPLEGVSALACHP